MHKHIIIWQKKSAPRLVVAGNAVVAGAWVVSDVAVVTANKSKKIWQGNVELLCTPTTHHAERWEQFFMVAWVIERSMHPTK